MVDLVELEKAIRSIPQRRDTSPNAKPSAPEAPSPPEQGQKSSPEVLSARIHDKLLRSRCPSDAGLKAGKKSERNDDDSDVEDDAYRIAHPMVRKKSGELVKSSLKSPLHRRPSSMPSTPTFPKAVHFDSHLEHVRHFLQAEQPTAVSADSSPVETEVESEDKFPFPSDHAPVFEWEISLPNFPESVDRSRSPLKVERVFLSHDKKSLLGVVAVANIAYHKSVVARFTIDFWQTTSEVTAEYNNEARKKQREDGYDSFIFKIKLEDITNLEKKTLFFCVRYRVADQEHWDNNSTTNYQVLFKKKVISKGGMDTAARSNVIPRSRPSVPAPRPRSMPVFDNSFDAFNDRTEPKYNVYDSPPPRLSARGVRRRSNRSHPPVPMTQSRQHVEQIRLVMSLGTDMILRHRSPPPQQRSLVQSGVQRPTFLTSNY
jgi:hypothetical protein